MAFVGVAVAAACVLAGAASSRSTSDIYIWGTVLGRAKGSDASVVQLRWAYKCLGDKLGYATFDWNLKVERDAPLPKKTTLIAHGTSKRGQMNVTLPPGDYLPLSDPYECTTERGAGYSQAGDRRAVHRPRLLRVVGVIGARRRPARARLARSRPPSRARLPRPATRS